MAMMPKRIKHRKQMRGKMNGMATRGQTVDFGDYGIQSLEAHWITARQLEAGRVAATHYLHREGKVYIRIFPDKPISSKPLETRMGKGKGETKDWVACVKPGTVLFEIGGVDDETAKQALVRVAHKMPVRCRLLARKL
ncbi:MAG: 50S ribosomal protein L16 [Phycisphaerae bacterium]|jgi:large subunit ribosomal protein L16|nr:50S ribosomal protein L16 [Phycisphaerae bacterium]